MEKLKLIFSSLCSVSSFLAYYYLDKSAKMNEKILKYFQTIQNLNPSELFNLDEEALKKLEF